MTIRWWRDALKAAWDWLSRPRRCGLHTAPAWLRRDLGLTDDDTTSLTERIDEIRSKHSGWI